MDMQSGYLQMGQKIEIAFCAQLIYSETENYRRKGTVSI